MIDNAVLKAKVAEVKEFVLESRRELHKIPELSGSEVKTKAFIRAEIDKLGLPVEDIANTAQLVIMDTGRPGKSILLRADIDGLPMQENANNLKGPRSVISEHPGCMHACGHDGHTAMLLGSMKVLHSLKDLLTGKIYFMFEEGEENGGSIAKIMQHLKDVHIDAVWGVHLMADIPAGKIDIAPGPRMAGVAKIDVDVIGKGGHGSRPDLSINPTFAAAMMFPNAAAAFANQIDVSETVTLGLASLTGGSTHNIFPDVANIKGTLRFFNREAGQKGVDVLRSVCEHTAAMNGCTIDFKDSEIKEGPTVNDAEKTAIAREALGELFADDIFIDRARAYGTDSMNQYLSKYPGVYMMLGVKNEAIGSGADHHNEFFDIDEAVLDMGVLCSVKYATQFV